MLHNKFIIICKKYYIYILYLFLILIAIYLCFAKLEVASLQHWDEARHGVNAYEMFKTKNYIVNTYNYENDYFNLKPPLSYWCIIAGFQLLGVSIFSMRFYSALSLVLTFILMSIFMHKNYGKLATISSMLLFLTCSDIFFQHAGRNADADAVYILLFTIALLCMLKATKNLNLIYLSGLAFSFAFLAKSWHALILLPIGGLYLIFSGIWKQMKLKTYIIFFTCAFAPILLWAFVRYQYDQMSFLGQMFSVDVSQRISGSTDANPTFSFFTHYLLNSKSISLIFTIIILCFLYLFFSKKIKYSTNLLGFLLWILVPFIVYNVSHTYYYWYIFPIYIPVVMVAGILLQRVYQSISNHRYIYILLLIIPFIFTIFLCRSSIMEINNLEVSGFQNDIRKAMEENPSLHGMDIYVEKSDNEYKEDYYWEQAGLLAAELSGDLKCKEGGVSAFMLADVPKLIIVDTATYNRNSLTLSDLPIIYQNEYILIKSN